MKKSILSAILIFALIFAPDIAHAASSCSYSEKSELNAISANVRATYEIVDIKVGTVTQLDSGLEVDPIIDSYKRGFHINILNITDDIYVKVTNNFDAAEKVFYKSDTTDGIASFETTNNEKLITYTFNVYANKYSCTGELIRTFTITTPAYNNYSQLAICTDYPNFYYCQEFLASGPVEYSALSEAFEKYQEEQPLEETKNNENKSFWEKIKEFYNNNKLIVNISIVSIIIIAVGGTIVILIRKKRRVL